LPAERDVREPAAEHRRRLRALLRCERVAEADLVAEVVDAHKAGAFEPPIGVRERLARDQRERGEYPQTHAKILHAARAPRPCTAWKTRGKLPARCSRSARIPTSPNSR